MSLNPSESFNRFTFTAHVMQWVECEGCGCEGRGIFGPEVPDWTFCDDCNTWLCDRCPSVGNSCNCGEEESEGGSVKEIVEEIMLRDMDTAELRQVIEAIRVIIVARETPTDEDWWDDDSNSGRTSNDDRSDSMNPNSHRYNP